MEGSDPQLSLPNNIPGANSMLVSNNLPGGNLSATLPTGNLSTGHLPTGMCLDVGALVLVALVVGRISMITVTIFVP